MNNSAKIGLGFCCGLPAAGIVLIVVLGIIVGATTTPEERVQQSDGAPPPEFTMVKPLPPVSEAAREPNPSYKIVERKRVDAPGVPRLSVKMTVTSGFTREALSDCLLSVAKSELSDARVKAVMVFAYAKASDVKWGFTAGRCEYAPFGDWGRASEDVPESDYQAKVDFADEYRFKK